MQDIGFKFSDAHFCLAYPNELTELVKLLFRDVQRAEQSRNEKALEILRLGPGDSYRIISASRESEPITGYARLLDELSSFIQKEIVDSLEPGLSISAAALAAADKVILFPGLPSTGKSMLASFLLSKGWHCLTDRCAHFDEDSAEWHYLGLPPAVNSDDWPAIGALLGDRIRTHLPGSRKYHLILEPTAPTTNAGPPALLVFPSYLKGGGLSLAPLSPERATAALMSCMTCQDERASLWASTLTGNIAAVQLTYGEYSQLEHLGSALSYIAEPNRSNSELKELLASFVPRNPDAVHKSEAVSSQPFTDKVPEATPIGKKKVMTIGMATYDDYDGVYFTVQAIRLYHPEVTDKTEILVVDNHPDGPAAQDLKNLEKIVANYRYFPFGDWKSSMVKDLVFRQANADYVLCLDGHVMLPPGVLKRLLDYFEAHPDCPDLIQGPMFAENLNSLHTHFEPEWTKGMYGFWGTDERAEEPDGPPFEIPMQGLGLFACRKDAWVGFNPRFRGFGGEEGYLHEKFRQGGGRTLCLPFLRWLHRFSRPGGVPYSINWEDRIFNYMVGCEELGLDTGPVKEHFKEHLGEEPATEILNQIEEQLRSPFFYFEAIYCISDVTDSRLQEKMNKRFQTLGIDASVRFFKPLTTDDTLHRSSALSHRAIISEARQQGLNNVLVFEDDILFLDKTLAHLSKSVEELKRREWNLFHLGGHNQEQPSPLADGCRHLRAPQGATSAYAIAYCSQVFEKILQEVVGSQKKLPAWLREHHGYDNYLRAIDNQFLAEPAVAITARLLPDEDDRNRKPYNLGDSMPLSRYST